MDGLEEKASTNGTWMLIQKDMEIYNGMIIRSGQTIF
jgi:hypothetical protein